MKANINRAVFALLIIIFVTLSSNMVYLISHGVLLTVSSNISVLFASLWSIMLSRMYITEE